MSDLKKSTDELSAEILGEVSYREIRAQEQQRSASRRYALLDAVDAYLNVKPPVDETERIDDRWKVLGTAAREEKVPETAEKGDAVLISPTASNVKHTRRLPDLVFHMRPRKETQA